MVGGVPATISFLRRGGKVWSPSMASEEQPTETLNRRL